MKKVGNFYCLICTFLLLGSCSNDDNGNQANIPPSEVTNIQAEIINETMVRVYWDSSIDTNEDELSYDIIINDKMQGTKVDQTSIEFDASEFILTDKMNDGQKSIHQENFAKSTQLQLKIEIMAYDGKGGVSERAEAIRSVTLNRPPTEFEFTAINFDIDTYNWIEVYWSGASDSDGDEISYDVFFNDIAISTNYKIKSYDNIGKVYYNKNFEDNLTEQISIRIVAKDESGGESEIEERFDFTKSEVNLGELAVPFRKNIPFIDTKNGSNQKKIYSFSVSSFGDYSISSDTEATLTLKDQDGTILISNENEIPGENLSNDDEIYVYPDTTYYLEVTNFSSSGNITFGINDTYGGNKDLGILEAPFEYSFEYIVGYEGDDSIEYKFETLETIDYTFTAQGEAILALYNSNGENITIQNGSGEISDTGLESGVYYLSISNRTEKNEILGKVYMNFQ
ncbi:hypothetical protein [Aquimarina pacifica]|uniref:hypothetical protein n=1 Tax=Aquimarina pacifica TaxID=1296415 RepID=UPI00046EA57B|nr:hypothetical protein [Aquimarina pacifica]